MRRTHPPSTRPGAAARALCLAASLALTGCATPPPPAPMAAATAADAAAEADGRARYDADLQACRAHAQQIGVLRETLDAVVQGALVAAFLAWGLGRSDTGVRDWAIGGAALVGGSQGLQALERRSQWVAQCMAGRGHRARPLAGAGPQASPVWQAPAPWQPAPPARPTGADAFSAERLARDQACHPQPVAILVAKGPGFESYSVPCRDGDALAIRCEFGNCRVLR